MNCIAQPFAESHECLDDLMRSVFKRILAEGQPFKASKGDGRELLGVSLRLEKPRSRLSRSEMRGKVFSGLGELLWYLSGSNSLDFIKYYIGAYDDASDDKITIHGAYGPRLFGSPGPNQVQNVLKLLKQKPTSRRAVMQIFFADDLSQHYEDIPCTCTIQAVLRDNALSFVVYMRSNDAYLGLPHDVFAFTMLQEMMACALKVDVGFYHHMVGNIHLYDSAVEDANRYLSEGFMNITEMPPMPLDDPWPTIVPMLVEVERKIRMNQSIPELANLDPYWADIIRLLCVHSERKRKEPDFEQRIQQIRKQMNSRVYNVYMPELCVAATSLCKIW